MTSARISSLIQQSIILIDVCFELGKVIPKSMFQFLGRVSGGRFVSHDDYRELEKMTAELKHYQQSLANLRQEPNLHPTQNQEMSQRSRIERKFDERKERFSNKQM